MKTSQETLDKANKEFQNRFGDSIKLFDIEIIMGGRSIIKVGILLQDGVTYYIDKLVVSNEQTRIEVVEALLLTIEKE